MKSKNNSLIGYTGFIGSNLQKTDCFSNFYNSKNIKSISQQTHETIVCAAPGATKWKINKEPHKDLQNIEKLFYNIKDVKCNKFILLSTIDVHTSLKDISYGGNRHHFENKILKHFPNSASIIRLPGLFGPNLKKNTIYDLQNERCEFVNLNSSFQWLHVKNIIDFISLDPPTGIHELYPEPIETNEIVDKYFPHLKNRCSIKERSEYKFIPSSGYYMKKSEVLKDLKEYLNVP